MTEAVPRMSLDHLQHLASAPQRSQLWHCLRALRITAFDVAAAVGERQHETPE